jgi:tricarballylate dehydrogenase
VESSYDVLVLGGGNAALCAAISAREAGARVLLVEHAPRPFRGGNSRHTRNLRVAHRAPMGVLADSYAPEEYWADLERVTAGKTDRHLAQLTIRMSETLLPWMIEHGVRFQKPLTGTLSLARTNSFFLGGGKALVNAYCNTAERMGVELVYESEVTGVALEGRTVGAVTVRTGGESRTIRAGSVVAATGGFQANIPWLKECWGEAAENFLIRGTPYARGVVLKALLDQGVAPVGDPTQCHAVAIDARAPRFDGGIVTRLDCIPFSIVVNRNGERFYDEGEDLWPKRYAIWGRLVAHQPGQIAYAITDSKALELFMPSLYPALSSADIGGLAGTLGIDADALEQSVEEFNASVGEGAFDPGRLDGCSTAGICPPKSNWARRIDTPPYYAYPLRPGITFTYLGVHVDEWARVLLQDGRPTSNLFAAGEIMAGNILGQGYLAGLGMTIGTVFGRIAGREAAAHALG